LGSKERGRIFYNIKKFEAAINQIQNQFKTNVLTISQIEQVAPQHFQVITSSTHHHGRSRYELFANWLNMQNNLAPVAPVAQPNVQVRTVQHQGLDMIDKDDDDYEETVDEEEILRIQQERLLIEHDQTHLSVSEGP